MVKSSICSSLIAALLVAGSLDAQTAGELERRIAELSRYENVLHCLSKPLDLRQIDKLMEFLRNPPSLQPAEKSKLLEVLTRIEQAVHAET